MFTEPADQSVWWYHHFLLTWAEEGIAASGGVTVERYEKILRAEASTLEELVEVEGRCKVQCRFVCVLASTFRYNIIGQWADR